MAKIHSNGEKIRRRQFIQICGKTIATISAAFLGIRSLMGCASRLKEIKANVYQQEWAANPVIPVPSNGCYTGLSIGLRPFFDHETNLEHLKFYVKKYIDDYTKKVNKPPSIYAVSASLAANVFNENFPTNRCLASYYSGAIPLIKYMIKPFKTFREIAIGKFDKEIAEFAERAKEFNKPYFFIPFGELNFASRSGIDIVPFFGMPPDEFKEVYIHMHGIFRKSGANKNTVWVIQFETDPWGARYPGYFYPGDQYVDWIGFTVQNRTEAGHRYQDFRYRFREDYDWARRNHPSKPIMLVEFGKSNDIDQPEWLRKAYTAIKEEFPAIKAAMAWEGILRFPKSGKRIDDQSSLVNPESIKARRKALEDPYFIGSISSTLTNL